MQNNSNNKNSSKIIGAVVIVLLLIGGIFFVTQNNKNSGYTENIPKDESALALKQIAPDFSLEKLGGGTISLAEYRGQKGVVLDFFATWCPNCRRDMPKLNTLYEKYKDQVEVIGIDLQENTSLVQKTITDWGINFPIALDPNGSASSAYGVRYTNFHVLIDKDGNILKTVPGDISESDIQLLLN